MSEATPVPATATTTSKLQHLKKPDGQPLWRKDIQFDFLSAIFNDETKVFQSLPLKAKGSANPPSTPEMKTFCQVYTDAMAASSRCSKVLREKLYIDQTFARNIGMVCLLVNTGRINTTLNFFVEMKAQLRTYHSIPSLQKDDSAAAQKQLQDAPRLKSILKSATEDEPETLEGLLNVPLGDMPRTNPVNLIFILANRDPNVSEQLMQQGDFWDLIINTSYTSKSRAQVFLWLMWWWMHSPDASLDYSTPLEGQRNPFGGEGNKAPSLVPLTREEEEAENVDPPDEVDYAERMIKERQKVLEDVSRVRMKISAAKKDQEANVRTSSRAKKRKYSKYDAESESEMEEPASSPHPLPTIRLKVSRFSPTTQSKVEKEVEDMVRQQLMEEDTERWKEGRIAQAWKRKANDDVNLGEAQANANMWKAAIRISED